MRHFAPYIKIYLLLFVVLLSSQASAQYKGINFEDTVYFDRDWTKIKKSMATYYRPPVKKDSVYYHVEYRRTDHTPVYKGRVKSVKVDYNYSISPGLAIRDGYFTYYYKTGSKELEGNYSNDIQIGEWKAFYTTGELSRNLYYYVNQPTKYTTAYYKNGYKKYQGLSTRVAYKGDTVFRRSGEWIYYYENEATGIVLNYEYGVLSGPIKFMDSASGNIIIDGKMSMDFKSGLWSYYNPVNKNLLGERNYKNDLFHGVFKSYYAQSGGLRESGNYEDGLRTGYWYGYYDSSGKIMAEVIYSKNKGHVKYYDSIHSMKVIAEGDLYSSYRVGNWTRYYAETGTVMTKEYYKDNVLNGTVEYYNENGDLVSEIPYKNGVRNGNVIYYYPSLKKKWTVMEFKEDTLTFNMNSYYEDGSIKRKVRPENGTPEHKCYDRTGNIEECQPFYIETSFDGDVMTYISNNLLYPPDAKRDGAQGKVKVSFYIDEYGSVRDAHIVDGFDSRCDEEALRLVNMMPAWKPTTVDGIPIPSSYKTLPIVFWIPEAED